MEAKYTPTPWSFKDRDNGNTPQQEFPTRVNIYARNGLDSVGCAYVVMRDTDRAKANARRIVACVNACEGIPTEALECQSKRKISESWVKQRDKLVSACQRAEAFIAGFEDDETQEGIAELLAEIRSAASLKSTA